MTSDLRKLIVGREITLSGEINSCDKLVIEGSVEANLQNCTEVELAESGLFKGSATIDEIDVRGRFEGTLTVRKRLADPRHRAGVRHDPLRPDRDRVRRPDFGRRAGECRRRAARDAGKPRRVLTRGRP